MSISRQHVKWLVLGLVLASILAGIIFYRNTGEQPPEPTPTVQEKELPLTRENLLKLVNEERAKVGVKPLIIDDMLNKSAQWKADDMEAFGYFGHIKPGETVNNGLTYLGQLDYENGDRCNFLGENISWNENNRNLSTDDALDSWINSKSHYEAMIDPKYTLTGFGLDNDSAVQHFCQLH